MLRVTEWSYELGVVAVLKADQVFLGRIGRMSGVFGYWREALKWLLRSWVCSERRN